MLGQGHPPLVEAVSQRGQDAHGGPHAHAGGSGSRGFSRRRGSAASLKFAGTGGHVHPALRTSDSSGATRRHSGPRGGSLVERKRREQKDCLVSLSPADAGRSRCRLSQGSSEDLKLALQSRWREGLNSKSSTDARDSGPHFIT